jgi:hypothetical protein
VTKYLVLWEIDPTRVPTDAKERATAWLMMMEMVKADTKKGFHKDWGAFPAESKGYSIEECSEADIMSVSLQYQPYVRFEVHPVISLAQDEQVIRASMK